MLTQGRSALSTAARHCSGKDQLRTWLVFAYGTNQSVLGRNVSFTANGRIYSEDDGRYDSRSREPLKPDIFTKKAFGQEQDQDNRCESNKEPAISLVVRLLKIGVDRRQ